MSVESIAALLAGVGGLLAGVAAWQRSKRADKRTNKWLALDGELAEASERVNATVDAHESHVAQTAEEIRALEDALRDERHRRAKAEAKLVRLRAEVANLAIKGAAYLAEIERLQTRIDQLIGRSPVSDVRPPFLDGNDRES